MDLIDRIVSEIGFRSLRLDTGSQMYIVREALSMKTRTRERCEGY